MCFGPNAPCGPPTCSPSWSGRSGSTARRLTFVATTSPEFIAKEVPRWLAANQIKTIYIDPGSPWQNGFVESFRGRFRDECLNQEQLWTLTEAHVVVADFRHHDNHARPHGKLGYQSPVRFAAQNPRLAVLTEAGQSNPPTLDTDRPLG